MSNYSYLLCNIYIYIYISDEELANLRARDGGKSIISCQSRYFHARVTNYIVSC